MEKIRNALVLVKASWRVLMLDKELLVFPVLSLTILAALLMAALGPIGMFSNPETAIDTISDTLANQQEWVLLACSFVAYFIAYFVMIFFNAAMIACVKIRFAGGDPTVMDGLRFSTGRLPQILAWALVASSVGFVLGQLEKKSDGITRFLLGFLGSAWAVSSYFVVPVLVSEHIGPISAVKRSVAIVRKTWGESLVSVVGLSVLSGISMVLIVGVFMIAMVIADSSPYLAISLGLVAIALGILSGLIFSTLGSILKAALYVYAVEGKIPDQFDDNLIKGAFSSKK
ncbi:MAG: DUF6159 family protein [Rhizobiaceae bacterium]|nr:DUF6159 family protein [Rhizobiaceae bacterium]